jgi:hypothetical protein
MRQSQQVMLKDLIDNMNMVEDPNKDHPILSVEPFEIPGGDIAKAAIGPLLVANEL